MRIYMDICKFNPKNHYYFNDSLHFFKSYKTKSEPNRTFNTTPISIRNLLRQTTLYDFGYENRRYSKPSKVSCRNQIPTIPHINSETNPHPLHYQCCLQVFETVSWKKLRCCHSSNMLQHWVGEMGLIYFCKVDHSRISINCSGIDFVSITYVRYCHKIWGS